MDPLLEQQIRRRQDALRAVRAILAERLHAADDPEDIDPDVALFGTGLGLDSVDALELVIATESAFGVTFPQETLRGALRTVNTLVDLVLELRAKKEAP